MLAASYVGIETLTEQLSGIRYRTTTPSPPEFAHIEQEDGIRTPVAGTGAPSHDYEALPADEAAPEPEPDDAASRPSVWHWQAAEVPAAVPAPEAFIGIPGAAGAAATHPAD